MATQHSTITGTDLHEPKGIASAAADKVYVADGAGSGTIKYLDPKCAATASAVEVYSADGSGTGTFVLPTGKVFAELVIDGGSTSDTLPAASAFETIDAGTEWSQGQVKNLTTVAADGKINILLTGVYLCSFWASIDTAAVAAGTKFNFKFAKDGSAETRKTTVQHMTASAERIYVSFSNIINFTGTAALTTLIGGDSASSGTAYTVKEAGMTALRLTE